MNKWRIETAIVVAGVVFVGVAWGVFGAPRVAAAGLIVLAASLLGRALWRVLR